MKLLFVTLALVVGPAVASAGADGVDMLQVEVQDRTSPNRHVLALDDQAPVEVLLQSVEKAYKSIRETVGSQEWKQVPDQVKDTIENTIDTISSKASSYVLDNKASLQRGIDEAIKQLEIRTTTVVEAKAVADEADKAEVECVAAEKEALANTDGIMDKLRELQEAKKTLCASSLLEDAFKNGEKTKQEMDCDSARAALDSFLTDEVNADATSSEGYTNKKQECDELRGRAVVAMCGFGNRLQQKCAAADSVHSAQAAATETFQQLQAHWESMQQIKCTLQRFQASTGVSLETEIPAICDMGANVSDETPGFEEAAGVLDMRDADMAAVMTDGNFTCQETKLRFSGERWLTGSEGYNYFKVRYMPKPVLLPVGAYPFDFCQPGELPEAPGGKAIGSLVLQLEDPAAFAADENVVKGMADAVAEMAGIPVETFTITVSNGDGAKVAYGLEPEDEPSVSVTVFSLDVPKGKPFEDVDDDFQELTVERAAEIIATALKARNATVPDFLNITITPPGPLHAPQTGFCVDGYQLYAGVLADDFGECKGTIQNGTCILPIEQAQELCDNSPKCAGVVDTADRVWLARHEGAGVRVAGVGVLPLSGNGLWRTCLKPAMAAVADASPGELCTSINATADCPSGALVDNAALTVGNTTESCCA